MNIRESVQKLWARLNRRYRMVFIDHESLSTARQYRVRPAGMIALFSLFTAGIIALTATLIIFVPFIRENIPGYTDPKLKEDFAELTAIADTLEKKVKEQEMMLNTLRNIKSFELDQLPVANHEPEAKPKPAAQPEVLVSPHAEPGVPDPSTPQEVFSSAARRRVLSLMSPVDGLITKAFDPQAKGEPHYGLDIAADKNSLIRAVADGVVIFSEYSTQTGYVIGIAHSDYNLISFYKHNSQVFKKPGSYVFSGEAIAVIGNTGSNSTGTHLHFELWYENVPVNPEDYILFK